MPTITHIDEKPDGSANITLIAKESDYLTAAWAEERGIPEIWIHDQHGERVVSYRLEFKMRLGLTIEEILGL